MKLADLTNKRLTEVRSAWEDQVDHDSWFLLQNARVTDGIKRYCVEHEIEVRHLTNRQLRSDRSYLFSGSHEALRALVQKYDIIDHHAGDHMKIKGWDTPMGREFGRNLKSGLEPSKLLEAPLAGISYHRADEHGSFSERDRKLIQRYTVKKTYHEKLKKVPFDLYVYVIDQEGLDEFGKQYPEGEIKPDGDKWPSELPIGFLHDKIDLTAGKFPTVFKEVDAHRRKNPTATHFIIGDNYSEKHQAGLTPWIIVHRLMHAKRLTDRVKLPEPQFKNLRTAIFTFKSARSGQVGNDEIEIKAELITQYLVTGDIELDAASFKKAAVKVMASTAVDGWIASQVEIYQRFVKNLKAEVDKQIDKLKGKVYYI